MKNVLIVGGNSGIGRSIAIKLIQQGTDHIYVVDRSVSKNDGLSDEMVELLKEKTTEIILNLNNEEYDCFDGIKDIDALIITAGFGRLSRFEDLSECEISNLVKCNELSPIRIIKKYYDRIRSNRRFYCAVMVSISGHLVSPYYSVYGAAKSGLAMFIENINIELAAQGYDNRILDCSPGFIEGTAFDNCINDYRKTEELASEIIDKMVERNTLFIPKYDEIFKDVINRYRTNPLEYGLYSYNYKEKSGRINRKPQCVVGYLSGTFDLFHIGHLNLLRNAKKHCDYLIVGVHNSGAWKGKDTYISLKERKEIVAACKYVDKVVDSCEEDSDAWSVWHYDKLIVGSDYQGSDRFKRYEEYFTNKDVDIIYLPYTKTTSSTQLRKAIEKNSK